MIAFHGRNEEAPRHGGVGPRPVAPHTHVSAHAPVAPSHAHASAHAPVAPHTHVPAHAHCGSSHALAGGRPTRGSSHTCQPMPTRGSKTGHRNRWSLASQLGPHNTLTLDMEQTPVFPPGEAQRGLLTTSQI